MASQAELMSVIQNLGQSNVPSSVNNGNPNTIFNVSSAQVPTAWDFAYSSLADPRPVWDGSMNLTPVSPPGTVAPPIGGPLPPDPIGGGGNGASTPNPVNKLNLGMGGNIDAGRVSDALTRAGAAQGLRWTGTTFVNPNGSSLSMPQWQQLVDMGLDVLGLDGDWFLSGSGNWDASNILASLIGSFTGLPVNNIMMMIGKYGASRGWSTDNVFVNHYLDNVQNDLDALQKTLDKKFAKQNEKMGQDNINKTLSFINDKNLQGTAFTNPSSLTPSQWSTLLQGFGIKAPTSPMAPFLGIGLGSNPFNPGSNQGQGSLAGGGIFGGGNGNFGPGGGGGFTQGHGGGMPGVLTSSPYYSAITDPDAIRAFLEAMRGPTFQTGADFLGRPYAD